MKKLLDHNPAGNEIVVPRVYLGPFNWLTDDQLYGLYRAVWFTDFRWMVLLAGHSGLRLSEMLMLRPADSQPNGILVGANAPTKTNPPPPGRATRQPQR